MDFSAEFQKIQKSQKFLDKGIMKIFTWLNAGQIKANFTYTLETGLPTIYKILLGDPWRRSSETDLQKKIF